jgi:hypothetical protein
MFENGYASLDVQNKFPKCYKVYQNKLNHLFGKIYHDRKLHSPISRINKTLSIFGTRKDNMNFLNRRRKLRHMYRKHKHQRIKGRKKFLIDDEESVFVKETKSILEILLMTVKGNNPK